jgi:lipopolysaccharide biosynthesis protein
MPNRGWDLAPLVVGFAEEIRQHEICLKLHGKKSTHNPPQFGNRWRRYLLSGLLGSPRNVGFIIGSFAAQPDLGVFMLQHWKRIARGAAVVGTNFRAMQDVLQRLGLSLEPEQRIEFPSGSMFWFRSAALAPLLDLGLNWPEFYGCRSRHLDGTIAHGLERCILIFAARAGFKWAQPPRRWAGRPAPDKNRIWSLMRPRKPARNKQ